MEKSLFGKYKLEGNGFPGFTFAGGQVLRIGLPTNVVITGIDKPIIITAAVQVDIYAHGYGGTIIDIANKTANANTGDVMVAIAGPNQILCQHFDDAGHADSVGATNDTSLHILTSIYDSTNIKFRIDGVEKRSGVASTTNTNTLTIDQIAIGDYADATFGTFGHTYFTGKIGMVLVYYGTINSTTNSVQAPVEVESYLAKLYNL